MKTTLALSTRIGVAILVSLAVVTAAVTAFVVANPRDALSRVAAPTIASSTPSPARTSGGTAAVNVAAQEYVEKYFLHPDSQIESAWPERNLEDLLPNHVYAFDSSTVAPLSAAIVVGSVASVEPGIAFDIDGKLTDFDVTPASARVVVVTVRVEHGFGAVSGEGSVKFAVRFFGDSDPENLLVAAGALGDIVAILDPAGKYGFDPSLYNARRGTPLIGSVASDGTISFPALFAAGPEFIGELTTVDSLIEAAGGPVVIGETSNGIVSGP